MSKTQNLSESQFFLLVLFIGYLRSTHQIKFIIFEKRIVTRVMRQLISDLQKQKILIPGFAGSYTWVCKRLNIVTEKLL